MTRAGQKPILFFCALTLMACSDGSRNGSGGDGASDRPGASSVGAGCDPTAPAAYPAGPYGHEADAVIQDFCVRGFTSPGATTLAPMALHDFYDPSGSGKRLLWLSGTEMWCDPCNRQTAEYGATVQLLAGKSVAFFQVIFTGPKVGVGPTASELKAWDDAYELPFWLAMDDQRFTKDDFPQPHPTALLIDTKTMRILYRMVGFTPAAELAAHIEGYL